MTAECEKKLLPNFPVITSREIKKSFVIEAIVHDMNYKRETQKCIVYWGVYS